jgi:hypothetical protein
MRFTPNGVAQSEDPLDDLFLVRVHLIVNMRLKAVVHCSALHIRLRLGSDGHTALCAAAIRKSVPQCPVDEVQDRYRCRQGSPRFAVALASCSIAKPTGVR